MSLSELTPSQARRIALAAQGFADPRPNPGAVTMRHVQRVIDRIRVVQVDSVNVLVRSQYLPFFSRLGSYDMALLDRARDGAGPRVRGGRRLVESWAHMASLVPPSTWPHLGFRRARATSDAWTRRVLAEFPELLEEVRAVVLAEGPLTAREVDGRTQHAHTQSREHWGWNWSVVKQCLEYLFWAGEIVSVGRNTQFERRYAGPEWVLPPDVIVADPEPSAQKVELMRQAVAAHGIGTLSDLRDYFRMKRSEAEPALAELERGGEVERVAVTGWAEPAFLHVGAKRPRRVEARALLSPFDSLVWDRGRIQRMFGFHYRIGIYTPAAQREHGYYVLPFLLGEELVARVDLKADRRSGALLVRSQHLEPGAPPNTRSALDAELRTMADWLGLESVRRD